MGTTITAANALEEALDPRWRFKEHNRINVSNVYPHLQSTRRNANCAIGSRKLLLRRFAQFRGQGGVMRKHNFAKRWLSLKLIGYCLALST